MKFKIIRVFCFFSISIAFSQTEKWDAFLQKNVSDSGVVNYKNILDQTSELIEYLSFLQNTSFSESWSNNKTKAFWMNAYNAYTVHLILENYPVSSILKIKSDGKDAWNQKFAVVGGSSYTLNEIEHEILRKQFSDPRIHVGINCASFSCPLLLNKAFTEENVEGALEALMIRFVNDPKRNKVSEKKIILSKIFEWYQEDFTKSGSLIDYINSYTSIELSKKTKIRYMDYNWSLNE